MFIKIYKSGHLMHIASLVILAILLFIPSFFNPSLPETQINSSPLWQLLVYVIGTNFYLFSVLKLSLIIFSALLLNAFITNNDLSSRISMLGIMFFIFLSFGISHYQSSLNLLIVNFLMIIAFGQLMNVPKVEFALAPLYNSSLIIGIAAMFYLPLLAFLPFLWISLLSFRIGRWREYVVSLIGMILPLFLIFNWYYFNDTQTELIESIKNSLQINFTFSKPDIIDLILIVLWSGLIVSILFLQINRLFERNIAQRQRLTVVEFYFLFCLLHFLLFSTSWNELILIIVPSSVILASEINNIRKTKWYDWYLSVIVLLTLVNRIMLLLNA